MSENKRLSECSIEELKTELVKRLKGNEDEEDVARYANVSNAEDLSEPTAVYFDEDCSFISFPMRDREEQVLDGIMDILRNTSSTSWSLEAQPSEDENQRHSPEHVRIIDKCVDALRDAPIHWNRVVTLQLKGFTLSSSGAVHHLLANTEALCSITFENCNMEHLSRSWEGSRSPPQENVVETLVFKDCLLSYDYVWNLEPFSNLDTLVFTIKDGGYYTNRLHRTETITSFLRCKNVYSFTTNCTIDIEDLSKFLSEDKSLFHLDVALYRDESIQPLLGVMEKKNTTLGELKLKSYTDGTLLPWETFEGGDRIFYYTLLNRNGRKDLLDNDNASVETLVRWLSGIPEDEDPMLANPDKNAPMLLSVIFGLLCLNPSLWSKTKTELQDPAVSKTKSGS